MRNSKRITFTVRRRDMLIRWSQSHGLWQPFKRCWSPICRLQMNFNNFITPSCWRWRARHGGAWTVSVSLSCFPYSIVVTLVPAHLSKNSRSSLRTASLKMFKFTLPYERWAAIFSCLALHTVRWPTPCDHGRRNEVAETVLLYHID